MVSMTVETIEVRAIGLYMDKYGYGLYVSRYPGGGEISRCR